MDTGLLTKTENLFLNSWQTTTEPVLEKLTIVLP